MADVPWSNVIQTQVRSQPQLHVQTKEHDYFEEAI